MKEPIEELFKKSLENHEFPYNEAAWQQLESHLPKKVNLFNKWRWLGGAAIVGSMLATTFFLWNGREKTMQSAKNTNEIQKKVTVQKAKNSTTSSNNSENKNEVVTNQSLVASTNNPELTPISNETQPVFINKIPSNFTDANSSNDNHTSTLNTVQQFIEENVISNNKPSKNTIIFPVFKDKCQGETIEVYNSNSSPIFVKEPNGVFTRIEGNESVSLTLSNAGKYSFVVLDGKTIINESKSFAVSAAQAVHLISENQLDFETGLPTIKASIDGDENLVKWYINGKLQTKQAKYQQFNLFNRGTYEIKTVLSEGNCKSVDTRQVTVSEDYNLLAVNAFDPYSSDHRKTTFLPFALTVRNTSFKLVILEPESGAVIFETNDVSQPWDGMDKRTGKMVPSNKAYIWKVNLSQPVEGEKSTYQGTITRI